MEQVWGRTQASPESHAVGYQERFNRQHLRSSNRSVYYPQGFAGTPGLPKSIKSVTVPLAEKAALWGAGKAVHSLFSSLRQHKALKLQELLCWDSLPELRGTNVSRESWRLKEFSKPLLGTTKMGTQSLSIFSPSCILFVLWTKSQARPGLDLSMQSIQRWWRGLGLVKRLGKAVWVRWVISRPQEKPGLENSWGGGMEGGMGVAPDEAASWVLWTLQGHGSRPQLPQCSAHAHTNTHWLVFVP